MVTLFRWQWMKLGVLSEAGAGLGSGGIDDRRGQVGGADAGYFGAGGLFRAASARAAFGGFDFVDSGTASTSAAAGQSETSLTMALASRPILMRRASRIGGVEGAEDEPGAREFRWCREAGR